MPGLDVIDSAAAQTSRFPEVWSSVQRTDNSIAAGHASSHLFGNIELDIAELEAAARKLRVSRNSCLPLLRLPLEMLGEIVGILASSWPATSGHVNEWSYGIPKGPAGRLRLGWILLGHVCQKLRNAVLIRNDLWAKKSAP